MRNGVYVFKSCVNFTLDTQGEIPYILALKKGLLIEPLLYPTED